jgi:hypothetical protein
MNASDQITKRIQALDDWRGKRMARLRQLVNKADKRLTEEWKWDTPVWSYKGNVCSVGAFFKGALLKDPKRLFNGGLEAKNSRSIKLSEGDKLDEAAFQDLVKAAVALNAGGK